MVEIINKIVNDLGKNHKLKIITILVVAVFLTIYFNIYKNNVASLIEKDYIKLILFIMLTYTATENMVLAVILTILILVSFQLITEHFSPMDRSHNFHATKPHLAQSSLRKAGNTLNLKLEHPNVANRQKMNEGRLLLRDGLKLHKEKHLTKRDKHIADHMIHKGNTYIHNGLGGSYYPYYDFYYDPYLMVPQFIEFDKILDIYMNDDEIMNILDLISLKFDELTKNKDLSNSEDLENKIYDIYKLEFDLLKLIYDKKKNNLDKETNKLIENKIDIINNQIKNNDKKLKNNIDEISKLLLQ